MDCVDPVVAGVELMEEQLGNTEELQPWLPGKTEESWYIGKYVDPMW